MLDRLTLESFQEKEGELFWVEAETGESVGFTLLKVETLPERGHQKRTPFSLLFQGPEHVNFPQGTIVLKHEAFESEMPVFMVAIEQSSKAEHCLIYQAIFN